MVKDIELDELERAAYVAGDEQTLKLLARIADLEDEVEGWEEQVSEAEADASAAWDRSNECECETAEKLDHIRACFEALVYHSGLDEDNPELLALGAAIAD
ncbi:MAG: hypothetical protein ACYCZR_00045 [Burkholderiales bacterium]|jgi:hypothetical protein